MGGCLCWWGRSRWRWSSLHLACVRDCGRRRLLLGLAFLLTVVEALVLLIGMYGLYFTVIDAAGRGG